jgi:tetraacyldisaccharide 4'-kinase
MLPTVTDLTLQRLKQRLWCHWFGDHAPSPFPPLPCADAAPALLKRSLQRRLLRARWASAVLWVVGLPILYGLSRLTRMEAARRQTLQRQAGRTPKGLTIAIGNLVMGGTGKTPLVIFLAIALTHQGHQVAVLSRGYKRSGPRASRQTELIIGPDCRDPSTGLLVSPEETGDEPWLVAWRAKVPVAIGQDRHAAATKLSQYFPEITVWLLDDGLSQTSLSPDLRILLLDHRGLGNGHCLPYGPLRTEWTKELALQWSRSLDSTGAQTKSTTLVLAHPKGQTFEELFEGLGLPSPERLAMTRSAACWTRLSLRPEPSGQPTDPKLGLHEVRMDLEEGCQRLKTSGRLLVAAAGIAQPYAFFKSLEALGLAVQHRLELANHHPNPLQAIVAWMQEKKLPEDCVLLTTEKDAVKLAWQAGTGSGLPSVIEWWSLQLELSIEPSSLEFVYGCKTT